MLWWCLSKYSNCLYRLLTLDENAAGVFEEGEYFDQQEQDPENFAEQGKLLHWACTYIHLFWFTCFTITSINDLRGVCHESYDFENPFPKLHVYYWDTRYRGVNGLQRIRNEFVLLQSLLWKSFGGITNHPSLTKSILLWELEMIVKTFSKVYEKLFCHSM